jgi:hypothetical protein
MAILAINHANDLLPIFCQFMGKKNPAEAGSWSSG